MEVKKEPTIIRTNKDLLDFFDLPDGGISVPSVQHYENLLNRYSYKIINRPRAFANKIGLIRKYFSIKHQFNQHDFRANNSGVNE